MTFAFCVFGDFLSFYLSSYFDDITVGPMDNVDLRKLNVFQLNGLLRRVW